MNTSFVVCAAVLSVMSMAAEPVIAKDLNYSLGLGPGSAVDRAAQDYSSDVAEASGGDLNIQVFPLELVSLPEMGPGIRDGLTDIGYMAAPYYPAEFAHSNFLAELSIMQSTIDTGGKEDLAYAGAMSDYIMTKCPECLAEFNAQNHVYMGHIASSPYNLLCNTEVITPEDLEGKRLRAGGSGYKRFADHFGAVGVQMAASEAYEALSQGVLDCAILSVPELTNFRLMEVISSVTTDIPGNVFGGTVAGNINRDVWQTLSNEERGVLLRAGANLAAGITWNYHSGNERDLKRAKEEGKTINEPSPELQSAYEKFVSQDLKTVSEIFSENYGVSQATEMQNEFRETLLRWTELVTEIDSADALGQLYWNEVFSKLDPESYAMD